MREKVRKTLVSLLLLLTCQAVLPPMVLAQSNKKVTLNLVQVPIKDFCQCERRACNGSTNTNAASDRMHV